MVDTEAVEKLKKEKGSNHINNDLDHILMRRSQNTLIVVGTGIILFSIWTVVKTLGLVFMLKDESIAIARKAADKIGISISDQHLYYIVLAVMLIIMLLFLAVRTYIGRAAISEGRGVRRRKGYLILAVILIIINTVAVTANYLLPESQEYLGELSTNNSMPALIIEVTSMIMMVEMVFAAVRLRRARRRISRSTEQKEQE